MTNKIEMPLYSFFEELRNQKFVLGTDEYMVLLEVLMHQVQEKNMRYFEKEAMYQLCKLLWFKPQQKEQDFRTLFEKHWKESVLKKDDKDKPINTPDTPKNELPKKKEDFPKEGLPPDSNGINPNSKPKDETTKIYINISEVENQEQRETEIAPRYFYFQENYVPFLKRNIGQVWRFLQKNNYIGMSQEIDIQETIAHLSKTGVLQRVVFKPYESNAMQMLTLIEHREGRFLFKNIPKELAKMPK